jgi:hypothetical protein
MTWGNAFDLHNFALCGVDIALLTNVLVGVVGMKSRSRLLSLPWSNLAIHMSNGEFQVPKEDLVRLE